MMTSTTTMTLPAPVDAAIFEKSSALSWERLVRGWLLGLLIAIGIGGSIWGFYQEVHKKKAQAEQAFETRSLQQANAVKSYLDSALSAMKSAITESQRATTSNTGTDTNPMLRSSVKHLLNSQHVLSSAAWLPNDHSGQYRVHSIFHSPFYGARTEDLTLGQDLSLAPSVKRAMDEVIDHGRTALASLGEQKQVIALAPVYTSDPVSYTHLTLPTSDLV